MHGYTTKVYEDIERINVSEDQLRHDDIFFFITGYSSFTRVFVKKGTCDIYEKMEELRSKYPICLAYGHTLPQVSSSIKLHQILPVVMIHRESCLLYDGNLIELFVI